MGLDLDGRAGVPVDGVDAGLGEGEGEAVEGLDGRGDGAGLGDVGAGDVDLFFVRRGVSGFVTCRLSCSIFFISPKE